ncbi:MAG: hypothetical protein ACKVWR_13745 [Acidimicrobiales bacterium]
MPNSSPSIIGLFVGLFLAVAYLIEGVDGFLIAVALGIIGWLAGRVLQGDVDVPGLRARSPERRP